MGGDNVTHLTTSLKETTTKIYSRLEGRSSDLDKKQQTPHQNQIDGWTVEIKDMYQVFNHVWQPIASTNPTMHDNMDRICFRSPPLSV